MKNIGKSAIIYTIIVSLTGLSILVYCTTKIGINSFYTLIFLSILSIAAESMAVPLGKDKGLSVGFAITLSAILILGPVGAAWVCTAGTLFKVLHVRGKGYVHILNTPFYKTSFNAGNYIISCILAGWAYKFSGGNILPANSGTVRTTLEYLGICIIPLILLVLTFLIVNSGILSILFGLISGQNFFVQWFYSFKWAIPNLFAVGAIGIIITVSYHSYGVFAVLLFFGPLILARFAFKLYIDMRNVYFEMINTLTATIEAKDKYTEGHSRRVKKYVSWIAKEMKLPHNKIEILKYAALLHDIGKIGIPEAILNKPSGLSDNELDIIKKHPDIGYKILEDVDFLKQAKEIIRYHHERYDGMGYPDHLSGNNIPLESSIMAVADAFDAMTSERPYRKAMSYQEALNILKKNSGAQFSPEIVEHFIKVLEKRGKLIQRVS